MEMRFLLAACMASLALMPSGAHAVNAYIRPPYLDFSTGFVSNQINVVEGSVELMNKDIFVDRKSVV